jgi:hypothetical protein
MNSTWMHPVAPSESPLTRIRLRGVSMGSDSRGFTDSMGSLYYSNTAQFSPNNYYANYAD